MTNRFSRDPQAFTYPTGTPGRGLGAGALCDRYSSSVCQKNPRRFADGIQALRHYRYEMDEKLSSLRKVPLHDWASHPADAYRTAAVAIREPEQKKEQEKRRSVSRLSPWS